MAKLVLDPDLVDSLDKLRDYHGLGSKVPDTAYGSMKEAAEHLGLNIDYMRACRRFAQLYTPAQLDRLCRACEADGYAIGWARMMLLLSVPTAKERDELLKLAVRRSWSKPRLQAEIRRRHGRRGNKGVGRPTKLDAGDTVEDAYEKIVEVCQKFESLGRALRRKSEYARSLWSRIPARTRNRIEKAEAAMAAMRGTLKK